MKLITRVLARSGELCFDDAVDGDASTDGARYEWIRSAIGGRPSSPSIVDFGCWTGGSLKAMKSLRPSRLAGLDLPGPWAQEARRQLPEAEIYEVVDFSPLPGALESGFDIALLLETIEHVPRGREGEVLTTVARSLKPGGRLILSTPAAGPAAPLDPAWWLVGHRHYASKTLRRLLLANGFSDVQIRYSGNLMTSLDIIALYVKKHIFHRRHHASRRVADRMNTGLYERRLPASANTWAIAVKK